MFIHPDGSFETGKWQTPDLYPESYFIDENTENGEALAEKIIGLYPFYTPIIENGMIVDAETRTPTPEEEEALKPQKTSEQIIIEQQQRDIESLMLVVADLYEQVSALQGGS